MTKSLKATISCIITGSAHTPSRSDHLPITSDEFAMQSVDAVKTEPHRDATPGMPDLRRTYAHRATAATSSRTAGR